MMKKNEESNITDVKVCIVGTYLDRRDKNLAEYYLQELGELVKTFGGCVVMEFLCFLRQVASSTYVTKGKIDEIVSAIKDEKVSLIVFDDEISPGQQKSLEKIFNMSVIDRRELILGIFDKRARSREARLQIALAREKYQLPRLKRMWTHLSKQKGGAANQKGEGEQQIELDKRVIKKNIAKLETKIRGIKLSRKTQKSGRISCGLPMFAIVGYTNAGKSTLFNRLTKGNVLVEDKLFATLDTTTRKLWISDGMEAFVTDTVGFIRKLPHDLVAAFRSTLEESANADIIVNVVDINDPLALEHAEVTEKVLKDLGANFEEYMVVFNKIDMAKDIPMDVVEKYPSAICISSKENVGIENLIVEMEERARGVYAKRWGLC